MKLLINICAHDGIISHYTGVGTIVNKHIFLIIQYLKKNNISYDINLITPRYNKDSFGYSNDMFLSHRIITNSKIIQLENGSNGHINYGRPDNWIFLTKECANFINNIDKTSYDKTITIYHDTPFANLTSYLNLDSSHITVWIPHSTAIIHVVDSAVNDSMNYYADRLSWEKSAIKNINSKNHSYVGVIGDFIKSHLINEYGLKKEKTIKIHNGEILSKKFVDKNILPLPKKISKEINSKDTLLISFGRAEIYKNLEGTMLLGKELNIPTVVVAQSYHNNQKIIYDYVKLSKKCGTMLYVDQPFNLPWRILSNYKKLVIVLIPSKKETMGLIINEVRKMNKNNILIVANNIDGLKEQIKDGYDGVLVDMDNIYDSKLKIMKYFNKKQINYMRKNSYITLHDRYDLSKNMECFLNKLIYGDKDE